MATKPRVRKSVSAKSPVIDSAQNMVLNSLSKQFDDISGTMMRVMNVVSDLGERVDIISRQVRRAERDELTKQPEQAVTMNESRASILGQSIASAANAGLSAVPAAQVHKIQGTVRESLEFLDNVTTELGKAVSELTERLVPVLPEGFEKIESPYVAKVDGGCSASREFDSKTSCVSYHVSRLFMLVNSLKLG